MQRMKHIFLVFVFILFLAPSAWSVDLNCPGGRWEFVNIVEGCNPPGRCWSSHGCVMKSGATMKYYIYCTDINMAPQCAGPPCDSVGTYTVETYNYEWQCPAPPPSPCNGKDCGNPQCSAGTPVGSSASISSGNLYHDQTLFQLPNSKPSIDFTLSYNSLDTYAGSLGKAWTHSFNINITKNSSQSLTLMKSDGKRVNFSSTSANTYIPDVQTGEHAVIIQNSDSTYTLTYKDGTAYTFNSKGRLTKLQDLNQNTTTLSYTGDNLIILPKIQTKQ